MGHRPPLHSSGFATPARLDPGSPGAAPEGGRPGGGGGRIRRRRRRSAAPGARSSSSALKRVQPVRSEGGGEARPGTKAVRREPKVARRLSPRSLAPPDLHPAAAPPQPQERSKRPNRHAAFWPACRRPGAPSSRSAPRGQGSPRSPQLSAARSPLRILKVTDSDGGGKPWLLMIKLLS